MKRSIPGIVASVVLAACALAAPAAMAQAVVVGGKAFTEQQIMTAMTVQLLKAKGFAPSGRRAWASAAVRAALENGRSTSTGSTPVPGSRCSTRSRQVRHGRGGVQKIKEVDAAKGITWLNMSAVNNTYAFAMNADEAQKLGIATMSDLAKAVKGGAKLTFASNAEFYARPDGPARLAAGVRLRVRPRQRQAHGHGPRLLRAQGPPGRHRRRVRDRRPHPGVQVRRAQGRQALRGRRTTSRRSCARRSSTRTRRSPTP
jgi:glycine betaine/choline ABC-type transport system substrate-binding protein